MLAISALTPKDREDLNFALDQGVDYIGLSFVQRPEDIAEARRLIAGRAAIMSKLEKPAAIHHLDEIVSQSDAVMVARGDLGVELPPEDVPSIQKQIIRECRGQGKPVVVATQMLESMISAPAPTRAEASDVATAIYDGADAVMLSAETASGQYPLEAVAMMNRIILRVEQDPIFWAGGTAGRPYHFSGGHRHLHHIGIDRAPRGARTAECSNSVPYGKTHGGAQACGRLGRAMCPHRRRSRFQRYGGQGVRHGGPVRLRQDRKKPGHHRRRPVRHTGRDKHTAHRLD
jgi:hypothetical protein